MRKFEVVNEKHRTTTGVVYLPKRADKGSAGYDFYSPIDFEIKPNETKIIPTDVKVKMLTNEVLLLFIRSSVGIKQNIILTNGTGVIDSTYYSNIDNDGNICCALTNVGSSTQSFKRGDRLMQGVFLEYLTVENDVPAKDIRTGGIGSSGK